MLRLLGEMLAWCGILWVARRAFSTLLYAALCHCYGLRTKRDYPNDDADHAYSVGWHVGRRKYQRLRPLVDDIAPRE